MWICKKCGEKSDNNFDACWKCGTSCEGALGSDQERSGESESSERIVEQFTGRVSPFSLFGGGDLFGDQGEIVFSYRGKFRVLFEEYRVFSGGPEGENILNIVSKRALAYDNYYYVKDVRTQNVIGGLRGSVSSTFSIRRWSWEIVDAQGTLVGKVVDQAILNGVAYKLWYSVEDLIGVKLAAIKSDPNFFRPMFTNYHVQFFDAERSNIHKQLILAAIVTVMVK
jgi:hypothetical protein